MSNNERDKNDLTDFIIHEAANKVRIDHPE